MAEGLRCGIIKFNKKDSSFIIIDKDRNIVFDSKDLKDGISGNDNEIVMRYLKILIIFIDKDNNMLFKNILV